MDIESLAFRTVSELSELVRTRKVTSEQLTRMYLSRLRRLDAKKRRSDIKSGRRGGGDW